MFSARQMYISNLALESALEGVPLGMYQSDWEEEVQEVPFQS